MNPHKESWQQDVGFVPKRSKNHLLKRFLIHRNRMFTGHSDKTKWERIGAPLFYHIPLSVYSMVAPHHTFKQRIMGAMMLIRSYEDTRSRSD